MPSNDPERDGGAPAASLFPLRFDDGSTIDVAHISGGAWPPHGVTLVRTSADGRTSFARFLFAAVKFFVEVDTNDTCRRCGAVPSSPAPIPAGPISFVVLGALRGGEVTRADQFLFCVPCSAIVHPELARVVNTGTLGITPAS